MAERLTPDICVIGAGSGGLSVAAACAAFGVPTVLIEKGAMGGDCLNFGCVPSKALIAAGRHAAIMREAPAFGLGEVEPQVNFGKVADHVQGVIAAIAPNDSAERFTGMGVHVIRAAASFTDRRTVVAGDYEIRARRFVLATGSIPMVPPIPGLADTPFFTNETIFANRRKMNHLIVLGGGPIGVELAQAHRRLGCEATIVEMAAPLAREDPEAAAIVIDRLRREGVSVLDGAKVSGVSGRAGSIKVLYERDGAPGELKGNHLLVAAGRQMSVEGLGLAAAGIEHDRKGIKVNKGLRTSNRRVYAIGDAAGGPQFTHLANYHAGLVVRSALFRLPVRENRDIIPRVTFADPELAQVGLTEAEARARHKRINVLRWPFAENDRAQCERRTDGFIKVVTTHKGKILGATVVGEGAGEVIQTWALALARGLAVRDMTAYVAPYPTRGEISRRVAITFYAGLAGGFVRRIIGFLRRFG